MQMLSNVIAPPNPRAPHPPETHLQPVFFYGVANSAASQNYESTITRVGNYESTTTRVDN